MSNIKLTEEQQNSILKLFSKVPQDLTDQFINIAGAYITFVGDGGDREELTAIDRAKYLNNAYNSINIINKLIALASNGVPIEHQQIRINTPGYTGGADDIRKSEKAEEVSSDKSVKDVEKDEVKKAPAKTTTKKASTAKKSTATKKKTTSKKPAAKPVKEEINATDIIKSELDNWGIDKESFGYKVIASMPEVFGNIEAKPDYKYAVNRLAFVTNKPVITVSSSIASLVKKADFTKSQVITRFSKLDKSKITKEEVLSELLDFCIGE